MARCPNCNKKLHLTDWKQYCPHCGVNLIYFKSNERLLAESEKAEIEHAKHQPGIDRAKASFFGSPPAIARVVISALPLAALFLPLCKISDKNINAISIYKYISDAGFGTIIGNALKIKFPDFSLALLLFSVIMIIVCMICLVMSLGKHGKIRNLILNLILLIPAVVSAIFAVTSGENVSLGAGTFVYILLLITLLIYNLYLAKKGLKINHTVCYIGGLKSEDYYKFKEEGMSELEIRKRMVEALTLMQQEVLEKEARAQALKEEQRAKMK